MSERPDMLMELVVDAERRWDAAIAMLAALEAKLEHPAEDDLLCHRGITTKEKCGRCSRETAARDAIAQAKAAGFGG